MDLTALDILVPIMERSIAKDVILDVGKLGGDIDIARRRRSLWALGSYRRKIPVAVPRGRSIRGFALGAFTEVGRRLMVPGPLTLPHHRRGVSVAIPIAIPIPRDGNPLVVDRNPVALRAIASQSFPDGHHRLLTLGSFANRLAISLANESDRLAVRRRLFPKGLAILAVTRALDRGRRRLDSPGIRWGRPDGRATRILGSGSSRNWAGFADSRGAG